MLFHICFQIFIKLIKLESFVALFVGKLAYFYRHMRDEHCYQLFHSFEESFALKEFHCHVLDSEIEFDLKFCLFENMQE